MNPRRLHSDTIFSINTFSFGSGIGAVSFWEGRGKVKKAAGDRTCRCASQMIRLDQMSFAPQPLTPALSQREREKRMPSLGDTSALKLRTDWRRFSLSRRERAGVRVSYNTTSTQPVAPAVQ